MKNAELNELVIDEATKIKKKANKKELGLLNIKTLDVMHIDNCIYG